MCGPRAVLEVYESRNDTWRLLARVAIRSKAFSSCAESLVSSDASQYESVKLVSFTQSKVPDVVGQCGELVSAIADLDGQWRIVPFYDQQVLFAQRLSVHGSMVRAAVSYDNSELTNKPKFTWYAYHDGKFSLANPPGQILPCDGNALGAKASPGDVPGGPAGIACVDGWALMLTDILNGGLHFGLYNQQGKAWVEVANGGTNGLLNAALNYGVPVRVLLSLSHRLPDAVTPELAAQAVVPAPYLDSAESGFTVADGGDWLATFARSLGTGSEAMVYRWEARRWVRVADVSLQIPPGSGVDGPGAASFGDLTGSNYPDVYLESSGADTPYFSVVSHIGGTWHAVRFDFGNGASTEFIGMPEGRYAVASVDACSCAAGPTTTAWYRFDGSVFEPVSPPGLQAQCNGASLTQDGKAFGVTNVPFGTATCEDGWAVGHGVGPAPGENVVGLFEQVDCNWSPVAVNAGGKAVETNSALQSPDGADIYAIPVSVLRHLAGSTQDLQIILHTDPVASSYHSQTRPVDCSM
jgi:hypothetical protein